MFDANDNIDSVVFLVYIKTHPLDLSTLCDGSLERGNPLEIKEFLVSLRNFSVSTILHGSLQIHSKFNVKGFKMSTARTF